MKIISLMVLRALSSDSEAITLASAYKLDDFNFFQRERYASTLFTRPQCEFFFCSSTDFVPRRN